MLHIVLEIKIYLTYYMKLSNQLQLFIFTKN